LGKRKPGKKEEENNPIYEASRERASFFCPKTSFVKRVSAGAAGNLILSTADE